MSNQPTDQSAPVPAGVEDAPVGQPFTRVYGRPDQPLPDSERFRIRVATQIDARFFGRDDDSRGQLALFLAQHYGIRIPTRSGYGIAYLFSSFFHDAPVRDVLDTITAIHRALVSFGRRDAPLWVDFVRTALAEEHMAYRVDDQCGLHPVIDTAFEATRISAIQGLAGEQCAAAREYFERAMDAIEAQPPSTRDAVRNCFDAAENLFKLIVGGGQDLTEQNITRYLRPQLDRLYGAMDDTTKSFANRMASGLADWTNASHLYRHTHGAPEVRDPDFELAVLHLNTGAGYVRWLAQLLARLQS